MSAQHASSKARYKDGRITPGASEISDREDPRLEAAQRRIRESVGQAATLEALREIVTNLLGCEEIALFTVEGGRSELLWSFGIDPHRHGTLDSFKESAMPRVLQGELHMAQVAHETQGDHPPLRVFIPICRHGQAVAVLVMVKLLPQKLGFDQADINLVTLLSCEIGRALFDGRANSNG